MINLIQQQQKKEMVKVFYYKLVVLFLVALSTAVFIFFVAILPSYFHSSIKYKVAKDKLETQRSEPVPILNLETEGIVKDLNKKLILAESVGKNPFIVSEKAINAVLLKKGSAIKVTNIAYENSAVNGRKITVQGNASSREALLLFRQSLEDSGSFKEVDLPISNFVKGSNIEFYLSLIPS